MAEFEAPTFSLGLDFGFDSEPQSSTRDDDSTRNPATDSTRNHENLPTIVDLVDDGCDEEFGLEVADSEPEIEEESTRTLKRLRRGVRVKLESERKGEFVEVCDDRDDDIEEFSSQEDRPRDEPLSTVWSSMSSTKFFQHGYRVLSTQTTSQPNSRKRKLVSSDPASTSYGVTTDKIEFPRLTISPLRRFQLLDSDSDDLLCDNVSKSSKVDAFPKGNTSIPSHNTISSEKRKTSSDTVPQNEDLWKSLSPMKSFCIPTPALDEVCEEYYRSSKEKNVAQKAGFGASTTENNVCKSKRSIQIIDLDYNAADLYPPAHRYFFHEDPMIQNLVRKRLSNFSPLGVPNPRTDLTGASVIDYMGQFNQGQTTKKQATQNCDVGRTSTKGRKNSKNANNKETLEASGSWVNPKSSTSTTPKDASRRRVHADGQSGGHWYTGSDSKKVYVTKSGQEFTGRLAFMQYKKESGSRFKKSKKKKGSKKK